MAHEKAAQILKSEAAKRKNNHQSKVFNPPIKFGDLVYLPYRPLGRNKIQDNWSPKVYKVVQAPDGDGFVYTVKQVRGTDSHKRVNRRDLRLCTNPLDNSSDSESDGHLDHGQPVTPADSSSEDSDSEPVIAVQERPQPAPRKRPPRTSGGPDPPKAAPRRSTRITAGRNLSPFNEPRSTLQSFYVDLSKEVSVAIGSRVMREVLRQTHFVEP